MLNLMASTKTARSLKPLFLMHQVRIEIEHLSKTVKGYRNSVFSIQYAMVGDKVYF